VSLPLAYDAFQIHLHDLLEEQSPVAFNVIEVRIRERLRRSNFLGLDSAQ